MPFLDSDVNDPLNPDGGALGVGQGGAPVVSGASARQVQAGGQGSGTWTNLNQYLDVNKGGGDAIVSRFQNETTTGKAARESEWTSKKAADLKSVEDWKTGKTTAAGTVRSGFADPSANVNTGAWSSLFANDSTRPAGEWMTAGDKSQREWNTTLRGIAGNPYQVVRTMERPEITTGGRALNDYVFGGEGNAGRVADIARAGETSFDFTGANNEVGAAYDAALSDIAGERAGVVSGARGAATGFKTAAETAETAAERAAATDYLTGEGYTGNLDTGFTRDRNYGDWNQQIFHSSTTMGKLLDTAARTGTNMDPAIAAEADKQFGPGNWRAARGPQGNIIGIETPRIITENADIAGALGRFSGGITSETADPTNYADYMALQQMIDQYGGA